MKPFRVEVVAVWPGRAEVRALDAGSPYLTLFLQGPNRPPAGAKVGDRGRLVFKTGPSYGLWFFEPDPVTEEVSG